MFSGIVEACSRVQKVVERSHILELHIARPLEFDDLKIGDSVAVNGVCLTLESASSESMQFAVGRETLRITGWTAETLKDLPLNLERSLKLGERIHGHLVPGHVDGRAQIVHTEPAGENLTVQLQLPDFLKAYVWRKGALTIDGVSLTVNEVEGLRVSVGLIPETLRRTNLGSLKPGQSVNVEVDFMARALVEGIKEARL